MKTVTWNSTNYLSRRRSNGFSNYTLVHLYDSSDERNTKIKFADTKAKDLGVKKIKFHHSRFSLCGKQFDLMAIEDGDISFGEELKDVSCQKCKKSIQAIGESL
jgi:hypothetical protein